jgi:hypothetical protein
VRAAAQAAEAARSAVSAAELLGPERRHLAMSAEEHDHEMQLEEGQGPALAREAQRYLAVVEFFRREGCEPQWRPEPKVARSWQSRSSQD